MKPRNKYEREIFKVNESFHRMLGVGRKKWIMSKFPNMVMFKYSYHVCTECTHRWKGDKAKTLKNDVVTCPSCRKRLKPSETKRTQTDMHKHFGVFQVYKGYQMYRMFYVKKMFNSKEKSRFSFNEVQRSYINTNGRLSTFSCLKGAYGGWFSPWSTGSGLELRSNPLRAGADFDLPNREFLDEVLLRGYNDELINAYYPEQFMSELLKSNAFETIVKKRDWTLVNYIFRSYRGTKHWSKYWPSIRLAYKYGNLLERPHDFFDQIRLLEQFKMDLHNPIYFADETFKEEHKKLVTRKNIIDARKRRERERLNRIRRKEQEKIEIAKIKQKEKKRKAHYKKYGSLVFKKSNIKIVVLKDLKDFEVEGLTHNHCVNEKTYYYNFNYLIMSARVNGKRTETVQIHLGSMEVIQCRGYDNEPTKYHDRIVALVKENMHRIEAIAEGKTKGKYQKVA